MKTFSGRQASQNEWELQSFIALLKERGVRSYLEVGSREGDTFYDVVSSLPEGSSALAIDLPGGMWGKSTTGKQLEKAAVALRAKGYTVVTVLRDSTDPNVVASAQTCGPFGAALIDGDHRYEGAKQDWLNYGPLARIVGFHDIVGHGQAEKVHGNPVEVPRLWAEIKASGAETVEFVAPGSKMGIGVVLR